MTETLLRELLSEVRAEHKERKAQFDTIERRLTVLERRVEGCAEAVIACRDEVSAVRKLAFEGDDATRKQIRLVSNFVGMTDPKEGNGHGNGGE